MWPGVANQEQITQNLNAGALVSVAIVGNLPMAVGILSTSRPQNVGKGKCVEILHHYMDELWMLHQHVPNDGFAITKVRPVQEFLKQEEVKQEEVKEENKEIEPNEEKKQEIKIIDEGLNEKLTGTPEVKILNESEKDLNVVMNDGKGRVDDILKESRIDEGKLGNLSGTDLNAAGCLIDAQGKEGDKGEILLDVKNENHGSVEVGEKVGDSDKVEIEEVKNEIGQGLGSDELKSEEIKNEDDDNLPKLSHDQMIMASFLTALYIGVQPNELPLEPSVLLGYMHRCKRSYTIDFSQSSYKKIGKFLQYAAKIKIIDYTTPIGSDHKLITFVDRSHNLLKEFVPIVKKMKNLNTEHEDTTPMPYPKIIFTPGFSPKYEFHDFFNLVLPSRPRTIFQKSEVNSLLSEYLSKKNLESTKKSIKTDSFLQKHLKCAEEISKSDFYQKGRIFFTEGYLAEYSSGLLPAYINLGNIPLITITITKGKGKFRKVTTVAGCESYLIDMDELQSICQKTFSATASVLKSDIRNKVTCELQMFGDHSDRLPKLLNEVFKVPSSVVVVKNIA